MLPLLHRHFSVVVAVDADKHSAHLGGLYLNRSKEFNGFLRIDSAVAVCVVPRNRRGHPNLTPTTPAVAIAAGRRKAPVRAVVKPATGFFFGTRQATLERPALGWYLRRCVLKAPRYQPGDSDN
jgi:hypothetical protein